MSIVLVGSTSGSCTLQEQAVAGTTTLTLPTVSGTVGIDGPAFSAYIGTTQTVTTGVFTKLALNTEVFDTANAFDSTTNYRFTPQVAGYYQFNGQVYGVTTGNMTAIYSAVYKNGALYQYGGLQNIAVGTSGQSQTINTLVYLNGTTDYVELYGVIIATGTCSFTVSAATLNWFNGCLVRGA